ncbi:MAG: metallophosphoesterase [Christensenellaceae bacterium]|jgi:predicted MPP superfamily phosphohydrolase|nr:metallophosphoesterase [Christensenellaceae bacterium]
MKFSLKIAFVSTLIIILVVSIVVGICSSKKLLAETITHRFSNGNLNIKIAQLSDMHYPFGCVALDKISEELRNFKPDFIFLTGDIIDSKSSKNDIFNLTPFCKELTNISSVYAVSGNHELSNVHLQYFIETLKATSISYLDNDTQLIKIKSKSCLIVGFADNSDFESLHWRDTLPNYPLLILTHRPKTFYNYLSILKNNSLILSGHAHGGLIRIFNKGLIGPNGSLMPKYTKGIYETEIANSRLIVSAGLGYGSKQRARFFNKFHIPLVEVVI